MRTVPVPDVGPDDVLVHVGAASVNALDWHYVTGLPMFARPTLGLRRPKRQVPRGDVAGVVEAVGAAVTRFQPGDRVFGEGSGGAFAEFVVAPADWLVPVPDAVDIETAATIGVAAETALQGLRDEIAAARGAPAEVAASVKVTKLSVSARDAISPIDGAIVGRAIEAGADLADEAVQAARLGFPAWSQPPAAGR